MARLAIIAIVVLAVAEHKFCGYCRYNLPFPLKLRRRRTPRECNRPVHRRRHRRHRRHHRPIPSISLMEGR